MKTLIIYCSRNGQTRKIANFIASILEVQQSCNVIDLLKVNNINIDWTQYDRILIGVSIYYGHFNPILMKFITQYQNQLNERINGLFSVSLVARKTNNYIPTNNSYIYKFLKKSPWRPDCCAMFAGALCYPNYCWFERIMIQCIMRITGRETDTSKEVEYTNWNQVVIFSNYFLQLSKIA
ncbi:menaquinone-dependent protoporphyrinogen IX dehydrogenase [Pantoea sp. Aalb]|uniref:menaquinone-dependent protoporphyrinogen IX dehydrogenase n=1 Tax=Pantoea sp. Aalb TaxID=2576762 RepID=UPI001324904B|nr:menaquinone-dependent protoporphyrinogen IX dehydrogenase [Pantoea sp. Aalb]MXP67963.1 menaquinone-dependent protoporphyrinogen IX dehydrogenase [Pantoea sp. Aalb]